jgi:recombination protein RecR
MNSIDKLISIFSNFPGIGPRQARRFVYYLLTRSGSTIEELAKNISQLKSEVSECADCGRFYEKRHGKAELCNICSDENRDKSIVMIVQRDIDLESVEKNGGFNGIYFVLGGSVPILEKEPERRIRAKELINFIKNKFNPPSQSSGVAKEIILGVNANPEGENTADFVKKIIEPFLSPSTKISMLGRGLSTGTELEYTDPETLKNALKNRG